MKYDLWKHQERMVDFADPRTGVIFDVVMGGGKSFGAIRTVDLVWKCNFILILAPKAVVKTVWDREFSKYAERDWKVVPLKMNGTAKRVEAMDREGRAWMNAKKKYPLAFVMNYEAIREDGMWKKLQKIQDTIGFDAMVFDELHRLKGPRAQVSKLAAKLTAKRPQMKRLGLTGTLMPHSPMDLWAQMKVIAPHVFGTNFFKFRGRYAIMGGFGGKQIIAYKNTEEMMDRCRDVIVRVTEEDANLNLPESRDEFVMLDLCPKAQKLYKQLNDDMVALVQDGAITAANAMVKSLRLAQMAAGFAKIQELDDLGEEVDSHLEVVDKAKHEYLVDLFKDSGDTPTICFCTFQPEMDMVHRAAKEAGVKSLELSGRVMELDEWQAGGAPIIVSQLDAGSEGVNFTRSTHCVFVSVGVKGGKYRQAKKRAHRPGQKYPVLNTHLTCRGTVDERNMKSIKAGIELSDGILEMLREGKCS